MVGQELSALGDGQGESSRGARADGWWGVGSKTHFWGSNLWNWGFQTSNHMNFREARKICSASVKLPFLHLCLSCLSSLRDIKFGAPFREGIAMHTIWTNACASSLIIIVQSSPLRSLVVQWRKAKEKSKDIPIWMQSSKEQQEEIRKLSSEISAKK